MVNARNPRSLNSYPLHLIKMGRVVCGSKSSVGRGRGIGQHLVSKEGGVKGGVQRRVLCCARTFQDLVAARVTRD